ncbi:MAG: hypothetical protein ACFFD6_03295 [Candidatus Thorarchaeota archaeon]
MKAGKQILIELGKKGLRGYFFDSSQYHELKKMENFDDVKAKILEYGYPSVRDAQNPKEAANLLKSCQDKKDRNGCLFYAVCEIIFWIVISLFTCSA